MKFLLTHTWVTPAIVAGYFVLSIGLLYLLNFGLPNWLEQIISAFITPAILLIALWNPLLRPLGLTTGEWYTAPTLPAAVVIIAIYTITTFAVVILAKRFFD